VESKWKNYHIITFPGQSLSKTLEEAMDLSQDRLILELEVVIMPHSCIFQVKFKKTTPTPSPNKVSSM
jgi:hypothetical protein